MRTTVLAICLAALLIPIADAALAQPAPRSQDGPDGAGDNERRTAIRKKRADCRKEAMDQGVSGQDLSDRVLVCVLEARLACLKKAIEQKLRGPERGAFVVKCLAQP